MSDLISRQAAIDAFFTELTKRERKNLLHTWSTVDVKYFITKMLEQMPSAQPDIVRCEDCKYHDKGENESESWNLCGYRPWLYVPVTDDHYCGWAKRKEGEADD